jgi:hypothetical protein
MSRAIQKARDFTLDFEDLFAWYFHNDFLPRN